MKNEDKEKIIGGVIIGAAGSVLAGKFIKDKIGKSYIDTFLRNCSDFEKNVKHTILERSGKYESLPSATTGNRILKDNDLFKKRGRHKKVEMQKPIFDPQTPNEVWSADFNESIHNSSIIFTVSFGGIIINL